ncbi:HlyD family type I secretion periplasmic adaptor subunit [uncultured Maritimibacter sp.]|jgi:HlyD family type I secretion membrane fusion protein|uniref:HlyD family type I secretion periplasmic adaptor subunit n=1 Tax=uncultured Maritimibacter sp. TaxID=991866 RepID=UPI0026211E91|nr:HlyD family type I secretion periplasmic adaptor subunit [uncultured Maritimibacter sp.]
MTSASEARLAYSHPAKPIRIGLFVMTAFVAALVGWSVFVPLSDASVARGALQVEGRRQAMQHPYGGVVRDLAVDDGDTVQAGDVLMTLFDTEARAERDVLLTRRESLIAQQARLVAERDGADAPVFPDPAPEVAGAATEVRAAQTEVFETRRQEQLSTVAVIDRRIDQLGERITGGEAEARGLADQLASARDELADADSLLDQGLATRPRVRELSRQVSGLEAQLASKRAEVAAAQESVAEARAEIAQLDRARQAEVSAQIDAVQADLAAIAPQIDTAMDRLDRMQVRAPETGRVVGLSVFTEGGVVEPGATLMEIVPTDTPFFIEAQLRLTDLHDIEEGQSARIELLAFPRSDRPELTGTVVTIAADSAVDERTGQGFYPLKIALDDAALAQADVALQSGMPVQVIMDTRPRTLIQYLTSPLLDQVGLAFRED